jgi:hypothetical protein
VAIWPIFPAFGMFYQEKSGKPVFVSRDVICLPLSEMCTPMLASIERSATFFSATIGHSD